VRCLGIETSSRRGSVALVESGKLVALASHERLNRHGEAILPIVDSLLAEAGWARTSIDRLGVGIGPGSFTGLRIGVALANGIALGIDRPLLGVGSLRAMARAADSSSRPVAAVLDALRDEFFISVYDANGGELIAPCAIPQAGAESKVMGFGIPELMVVGQAARGWARALSGERHDLPCASATALLAGEMVPADAPALPQYVRPADAIKPNLPPSPLRVE